MCVTKAVTNRSAVSAGPRSAQAAPPEGPPGRTDLTGACPGTAPFPDAQVEREALTGNLPGGLILLSGEPLDV